MTDEQAKLISEINSPSDTPDLDKAREALRNRLQAEDGVVMEWLARFVLEQRAEEAELCADLPEISSHPAYILRERAATLRRQAGVK